MLRSSKRHLVLLERELKSETSFKARKLMGKTKIEQIGGRSGTFKS